MALFSSADDLLGRSVGGEACALCVEEAEVEETAEWLLSLGSSRAALHFPDVHLPSAPQISAALSSRLSELQEGVASERRVQLFVLGDTSFDGSQLDFLAALHLHADVIVHYGEADLSAQGPLPCRLVFGKKPVCAASLAAALQALSPPPPASAPLLLFPSLSYAHVCDSLPPALFAALPHLTLALADKELAPCEPPAPLASYLARESQARALKEGGGQGGSGGGVGGEGGGGDNGGNVGPSGVQAGALSDGGWKLLGRRLSRPLSQSDLSAEGGTLVWVGSESDPLLSSLCVLLPRASVLVYQPDHPSPSLSRVQLPAAKGLMRRYYLVQRAREASVVGILVGTLSAAGREAMLAALKQLCASRGRKHYVFMMGKLNAAKLANFLEVGVYVLLGSAQHSMLENKEFYRPVVTPYELFLAFSGGEWTGDYILDYSRLLPMLAIENARVDSEDDPPQFSLLSGRLLSRSEPSPSVGSALLPAGVLSTGDYALARSGAEFLARREYGGLLPRYGEHEPAVVVEGLSGIASGFQGEGGKGSNTQGEGGAGRSTQGEMGRGRSIQGVGGKGAMLDKSPWHQLRVSIRLRATSSESIFISLRASEALQGVR